MRIHFYNSIEENVLDMNEYLSPYYEKFINGKKDVVLHDKWFARQEELDKWSYEEFKKGWKMMGEVFFNLWD